VQRRQKERKREREKERKREGLGTALGNRYMNADAVRSIAGRLTPLRENTGRAAYAVPLKYGPGRLTPLR
jgi:hypothetical protein